MSLASSLETLADTFGPLQRMVRPCKHRVRLAQHRRRSRPETATQLDQFANLLRSEGG